MDMIAIMKINGINAVEVLKDEDIADNQKITGYHKKVLLNDYVLITGDNTKKTNLLKKITVEISYKVANKEKNVKISTYITKY